MFKFRLADIMRLKEYNEEQCREEVGRCIYSLRLEEEKERQLLQSLAALEAEIKSLLAGLLALEGLKLRYAYRSYLREALLQQQQVVVMKRNELSVARQRLLAAMKERKVLEKLRAKKYEQYLYEQEKKEQAMMDELAGRI